jgi:GAF domain-containing protein
MPGYTPLPQQDPFPDRLGTIAGAGADWDAAESYFLYELARVLSSSPDQATLMGSITDGVCALLACEVALVHLNQAGRPVLQGWPELARVPSLPERLPQLEATCVAPALHHAEPRQVTLGDSATAAPGSAEGGLARLSALSVPVFSRGQTIGALTAVASGSRSFTRREIERLKQIADLAAFCLYSAWLAEEQQRHLSNLETLLRLDEALNAAASKDEIAQALCVAFRRLFPSSSGVLAFFGQDDTPPAETAPAALYTWGDGRAASCLRGGPQAPGTSLPPQTALCWSLRRGTRLVVSDAIRDFTCPLAPATDLWQAYVCVPLVAPALTGPCQIGIVSVKFPSPTYLTAEQRDLIYYVAERSAIALAHAQLLAEMHALGRAEGAVRAARTVAHEFSQPLSILSGYTELLAQSSDALPPDAAEAVHRIGEAVERLAGLIRQFRQIVSYAEVSHGPGLEMLDLRKAQQPLNQ